MKTLEVLSEHQESLFYCESDGTLQQVVLRGCGLSILAIQKPSGHGPGQPAVGGPA